MHLLDQQEKGEHQKSKSQAQNVRPILEFDDTSDNNNTPTMELD